MDKIPDFRPVGKEDKLAKRDTPEVFLSLSQIPLNEDLYIFVMHQYSGWDACIRRSCPETSLLFKTFLIIISHVFVTSPSKQSLYKTN